MKRTTVVLAVVSLALGASASWYWPFGSDKRDQDPPRLSEILEPASVLIDEASDFASDGKLNEAVAKYREALAKLDEIEASNPDRVDKPEFATVRNKRAYVNAAIDSLLMEQAHDNAKPVAVSDTTELEKRLAEERAAKKKVEKEKVEVEGKSKVEKEKVEVEGKSKVEKEEVEVEEEKVEEKSKVKGKSKVEGKTATPSKKNEPKVVLSKREQAIKDIGNGDYEAAKLVIAEMMVEKANDPVAFNLKATMEAAQGKFDEAEKTLDEAIAANPRNYYAYYNMAGLILQVNPAAKNAAKRYYETGRAMGGPQDAELEEALK